MSDNIRQSIKEAFRIVERFTIFPPNIGVYEEFSPENIEFLKQKLLENPNVQKIQLSCRPHSKERIKLPPALLKLLADSKLTGIEIRGLSIGQEGAAFLSAAPNLDSLTVTDSDIDDEAAKQLAKSKSLKKLTLYKNRVGDEGAAALADNYRLESLDITYNKVGNAGANAFLSNATLKSLALCSEDDDGGIADDESNTVD